MQPIAYIVVISIFVICKNNKYVIACNLKVN